jgi:hypothetical protein
MSGSSRSEPDPAKARPAQTLEHGPDRSEAVGRRRDSLLFWLFVRNAGAATAANLRRGEPHDGYRLA